MQNANCTICAGQRISTASFIADKYPGKQFVCFSSSCLSGKNNISLLGFQYFEKSNFMTSMMYDEDITDSTQKRLQWDAEGKG